jgi:hypothetical protein
MSKYWVIPFLLFLTACSPFVLTETPVEPLGDDDTELAPETILTPEVPISRSTKTLTPEGVIVPTSPPVAPNIRVEDPHEYQISQMLPFDAILPVYNPEFSNAVDAPLHDDELVMGVSINGESKAYPVTVLRFREMVDDELGGTPILVTW